MARPRIFVSSTYYDLRQVRADLEDSIEALGYEPVLHEAGAIPYGKDTSPESSAYLEVLRSDVVVFIAGGRYGTESTESTGYSIAQTELKRAVENGIQTFIFVEKGVLQDYKTFKLNRDVENVRYASVTDNRIFKFLDELYALPRNNPIFGFELASEITRFLKDQLAGLFQRFLQDDRRRQEVILMQDMRSVAGTLRELVDVLTEGKKSSDDAVQQILSTNHPAFGRIKKLTKTAYRLFFTDRNEMAQWFGANGFHEVSKSALDHDSVEEWLHVGRRMYIKFTRDIFDDNGQLRPFDRESWDDDWIQRRSHEFDLGDEPQPDSD